MRRSWIFYEIKAVREAYTEYKVRSKCLDYDDLLIYMKLVVHRTKG